MFTAHTRRAERAPRLQRVRDPLNNSMHSQRDLKARIANRPESLIGKELLTGFLGNL